MALSVDRPLRTMGVVVAPCRCRLPSADSMGASHRHSTVGTIQSRANPADEPAEDVEAPQGASPVPVRCRILMFAHGRGPNDYRFIIDSGASVHATGRYFLLKDSVAVAAGGSVRVANGRDLPVVGRGRVSLENYFTLDDVDFIPGLVSNIVSVSKLMDLDYEVQFKRTGCFVRDARAGGALVGEGRRDVNGMFVMDYLFVPHGRTAAAAPQQQGPAAPGSS